MRLQWLFLPFLMLLYLIPLSAEGISIGYGLDYSLNPLNASAIDGGFNDFSPGGHTSYFYVSFPISRKFSLIMTPGAYNLEEGDSQFFFQYNALTLNYELKTRVYPLVGAGFGGCIATLTKGPDGLGEVNSNGIFYRNTSLIWVGRIGVGYRITDRIRLIVEGRGIGFILEENLANLNSYNAGMNVEFRL